MRRNIILNIRGWLTAFASKFTYIEKIFAIIFLTAGLLFIFIIPPFQNPDEPMHFYRSYQLAKGDVLPSSNEQGLYGGQIPFAMRHLVLESQVLHNFDYGYKFDLNYRGLLAYKYGGEKIFEGFPNTAIYTPLAYIPSILAHQFVAMVNGPLLVTLYLARLLSLLLVLVAILITVRIIPFGKWIIFSVGLLPMTVASSVSLSADAMTISVSFLLIATTLRIAFSDRRMSNKWHITLLLLILSVSLVKQAHVALLPILFIIPLINKHYRSKAAYFALSLVFTISLTFFYFWYKKTESIVINFDPLVQPALQKIHIVHHPLDFIYTLFQTFFTNNANGFVIGIFGNFGWLTAPLPIMFIILSALTLYWSTKTVSKDELIIIKSLSIKHKRIFNLALFALFTLVVGLISVALYLYWTPYNLSVIWGIQGRYFIPILPLFLLLFLGGNAGDQDKFKRMVIISSVIVLVVGISIAYGRFYVSP